MVLEDGSSLLLVEGWARERRSVCIFGVEVVQR